MLAWPAKSLWPEQYRQASAQVQEAYRYAVANPDVMRDFPCFRVCGAQGHTSNLDCYVRGYRDDGSVLFDPMNSGGGVCIGVTRDVMHLRTEGRRLREIRAYVDEQWATWGRRRTRRCRRGTGS